MQLLDDCLCVNGWMRPDNETRCIPGMADNATLADASASIPARVLVQVECAGVPVNCMPVIDFEFDAIDCTGGQVAVAKWSESVSQLM